jgi:gamma-glutamylcyclotransferase
MRSVPHYFAYGSNMSRSRLETRVGAVRVLGRGQLHTHRHRFSKLGRDGTGKGNVEARSGESVWGVVYELDSHQLARLAGFELGYREESFEIDLHGRGELVRTTSYQALKIVPGLTPTPGYLEHYLVGMREHGIPEDYRELILGQI